MQHRKFTFVIFLFLFGQISATFAQKADQIFLFGNMWQLEVEDPLWENLKTTVANTEGRKTILFTGDFLDENGLEKVPTPAELAKLDKLLNLGKAADQVFFLPGDREWNNSKIGGLDKLIHLDDLIKSKVNKDILLSDSGCPGPKDLELSENLVLMSINSEWLVHPFNDRPDEEDVECNLLNETAFWSEIEDVLKDSEGKNVIIAAHHPIYSYGQFAGYKLTKKHFLPPVIGSFVAAYHQNVGTRKDLSHAGFSLYSERILKLMTRYPSVVFVSGHEFDLQGHQVGSGFHLNSGAMGKTTPTSANRENTFYHERHQGFMKVKYSPDGAVEMDVFKIEKDASIVSVFNKKMYQSACQPAVKDILVNEEFQPCDFAKPSFGEAIDLPPTANVAAGKEYQRGSMGSFIWGKNHRDSWAVEVKNVPYLPLDTLFGGLTPVGKGGGGQTYNLKFKSADGRKFSFRSRSYKAKRENLPTKTIDLHSFAISDVF